MKKFLWIAVGVLFLSGLGLGQALSRVYGAITDGQGKPVPDVKITITMKDQPTWKKEVAGDAKGNYEVSFTDGTKYYLFQLVKGDYLLVDGEDKVQPSNTMEVKPKIFASMEKDFTLKTPKEMEEKIRQEQMKSNPHLAFFEQGRQAYLAGDLAAARKAFDECIKAKPEFTKVNVFLADIDLKEGKLDDAIAKAEKALASSDDEKIIALRILVNANQQKGKKDKAKEYQKQLEVLQPDSAEALFNRAVDLLNAKDDAGAKPLLEKAVEVNPEFPNSYYELGFIYLREGDMAKSKATFESFLKLVPSGEKAETAKETIKWL